MGREAETDGHGSYAIRKIDRWTDQQEGRQVEGNGLQIRQPKLALWDVMNIQSDKGSDRCSDRDKREVRRIGVPTRQVDRPGE